MATILLRDLAASIKSTNAGAAQITFDIGFAAPDTYREVVASGALDAALIARLYQVPAEKVLLYPYDPALVIKITIPRRCLAGDIDERDFDGTQQFAPLLDVPVTLENPQRP